MIQNASTPLAGYEQGYVILGVLLLAGGLQWAGLIPSLRDPKDLFGELAAAALRRAGIAEVSFPERMDSEGLLALPALADLRDADIGFVTAPDGRNLLVPTLAARGARVHRAEVYRRESVALSRRALDALATLQAPACLLLSSGGALEQVLAQLPEALRTRLRKAVVVAASARLADAARTAGFVRVVQAEGPRPAQLMKAACTIRPPGIR